MTFEPQTQGRHYVFAAVLAVFFGVTQYRNSLKEPKEEEDGFSPSANQAPDKDPLYEEFLVEDSNRRLFPRPHLEKEFQSWQSSRGGSDKHNSRVP